MSRNLRFLLVRAAAPVAVLLAPLFEWRERRMRRWANREMAKQIDRMRGLVRVVLNEKDPNYLRSVGRAVKLYRAQMEKEFGSSR